MKALSTAEVIAKAESYTGIQAGIVSLQAVLSSPSYQAAQDDPRLKEGVNGARNTWPARVKTVLVLGLHHPEEDPGLDYWDRGNTRGNRCLRDIARSLQYWLRWTYHQYAYPLPYHVEKGGIFLKDAAVLSGLGILGRNNLFIHPKWGPRIRLRAILLENELQATGRLADFSPCQTCRVFCQKACPRGAFPRGKYSRPICKEQMNADLLKKIPCGEIGKSGNRHLVTSHCRACELSCPVGT